MAAYDWRSARATRPSVVAHWFSEDIGHIAAPGGVGKTTLLLWQAIHIILGRDLFGHRVVRKGPVVYVTKEDDGETLVARVRNMCAGLELTPEETGTVLSNLVVLDVAECIDMRGFRLTRISGEVVTPSDDAVNLAKELRALRPAMVFIDPAVSFGIGESRVNDSEQALIEAARLIQREVGGGVLYVHHTGKTNAREATIDQYTGRGGSAFADGSRMIHIMQSLTPEEWVKATGDTLREGESGVVYARPKLTWSPPQPSIYIKRRGYMFERVASISSAEGAQVQRDRDAEVLLAFLVAETAAGRHYSSGSLDDVDSVLKNRQARRAATRHLIANGKVTEEVGTTTERGGKPPKILKPVKGALD
jgi:RecA-family ATPase